MMTGVPHLRPFDTLPENFGEYVVEIAAGLTTLYGEKAGAHYHKTARASWQAGLAHPAVNALALYDGAAAAGVLMGLRRAKMGQISFIHMLRRYAGRKWEQQLATAAVRAFRAEGVVGITAECVAFCPLRLDATYRALGFEKVERQLMAAPPGLPSLASTGPTLSRPYAEEEWADVADTIAAAYRDHPGRRLHVEVREPAYARAFIESVASGGYGTVRPGYGRAVWRDGVCAGTIVGCEVAPDAGFVLQVAIRPRYQRQGIGRVLVRELAAEYRQAGITQMALGVTRANPAKRLYDRLGFEFLRPVNAYVWWQHETADQEAVGETGE